MIAPLLAMASRGAHGGLEGMVEVLVFLALGGSKRPGLVIQTQMKQSLWDVWKLHRLIVDSAIGQNGVHAQPPVKEVNESATGKLSNYQAMVAKSVKTLCLRLKSAVECLALDLLRLIADFGTGMIGVLVASVAVKGSVSGALLNTLRMVGRTVKPL